MQIMSCKRFSLKIVSFLMILCLLTVMFVGCGKDSAKANAYRSVSGAALESQTLASNSDYELAWDNDGQAVVYKSLKTGDYWSDILYDSFLEGSTSVNGNSPISITVANARTLKWDTVTSYSQMGENGNTVCRKIENGVRVTYFFEIYKIAIPVDYILKDDHLTVTVDSSKILEDGTDYKLVSISVAPYLCSVKNDAENGSLFIPCGDGAIMYSAESPEGIRKYTGEVYGADASRRNPRNLFDPQDIKLPVFGAYSNGRGLMGIIEKGATAVQIEAQAGNSRLGFSNVGAIFYVRGYDDFIYTYHGQYQGVTRRVNDDISGQVLSVSYYPLYGEEADYNGMAEKYRNYLLDNGKLKKSEAKGSAYEVTLLGGTNITTSIFGIPNQKLVPLTTFDQAENIIADLKKNTGITPVVRMMGYGDNGIRTGSIAGGKGYSSVYGGKKGLEKLLESSKETQLFFDYDIVNFSKSGAGFSLNFNVSKTAILHKAEHFPVSPIRINNEDNAFYIIARNKLEKAAEFAKEKAEKGGIKAVSLSSLGKSAFSDFSSNEYINKYGIESDVSKIFDNIGSEGYKTATANANQYAACAADVLFDTPCDNGDYDVFDLEIPFYQMIFHSYKPMYTDAVNLQAVAPLAVAKAAAFGMGLGYTLTHDYVDTSDDLDEFSLYGTTYSDNAENIKNTVVEKGYAKLYSAVSDALLVSYKISENGVSISEFSNGKTVYVNQTNSAVTCPAGELGAYEFIIG